MWRLLPVQSPLNGVVMLTVGPGPGPPLLGTVTFTGAEVVVLPAASRATAVRACAPAVAVAVFQATEYGAVVTSVPRFEPSSLNWTPTTPTLSVAVALTVVVPVTVAPFAGAVIATVGGVVSGVGFETVTETGADVVVLPAASRATAVSVWAPAVAVVVFQ